MKRGATKEEIIRTTLDLITRNGLRAVRVDEIAQVLGISKRTLYEMFADKPGHRERISCMCRPPGGYRFRSIQSIPACVAAPRRMVLLSM